MSQTEEILKEIKKLRSESIIKDILLALVPLLVAGISIYYSNSNTQRQLKFSEEQLQQNKEIENAKILESFSQNILRGGDDAKLAKIALDSVQLTEAQKEQLAVYFELESGGSDKPDEAIQVQESDSEELAELLNKIFSPTKQERVQGYSPTRDYLRLNYSKDLTDQMIRKIQSEQYNINGRSNVLSILAQMSKEQLLLNKPELLVFFQELIISGAANPALAVGPQTMGWIRQIREKLA